MSINWDLGQECRVGRMWGKLAMQVFSGSSPIGSCVIPKSTDPLKLAEGEEEEVYGEDTLDRCRQLPVMKNLELGLP